MGSVKSAGLSILLLSFLFYIADSYPNIDSKIFTDTSTNVLSTLLINLVHKTRIYFSKLAPSAFIYLC